VAYYFTVTKIARDNKTPPKGGVFFDGRFNCRQKIENTGNKNVFNYVYIIKSTVGG